MKFNLGFLIFIFVLLYSAQSAGREQVMIVTGEPGLLTINSYTKLGRRIVGSRSYMGKRSDRFEFKISKSEFAELWETVISEELGVYEFQPTKKDNLAHPDYYNVTVIDGQKEKLLRLPRDTDFLGLNTLKPFIEREK